MGFAVNTLTVSGNLVRDIDLRVLPGGMPVANFSIAHNERRKSRTGDFEDVVHYFDVVMFGGQAEWLSRNVGKGQPVVVSGQLTQERWQDRSTGSGRSAVKVRARDVVIGKSGKQRSEGPPQQDYQGGSYGGGGGDYSDPQYAPQHNESGLADPGGDDIPF